MAIGNSKILPIAVGVIVILVAIGGWLVISGNGEPLPATEVQDVAEPSMSEEAAPAEVDEAADDADETLVVVEESAAEIEDGGDEEIVLAQADTATAQTVSYKYQEGRHFQRMVPSQPTVGGADKIEVAEFFWYGCPHCYDLEPIINRWADTKPANVRFVKIPAQWNEVLQKHAQLFYTEEVLVRNGVISDPKGFRSAVFEEYHTRGNRLLSDQAIQRVFARFGVSEEEFTKTWNSFEVAQKLRVAADLARRYSIASVPTIVVNGKYRTGAAEAGSYPNLIELIDELVMRESAR